VWKPVITAVNGICCGGGFHWVADADIVIAASDAQFFDPHVSVGQVVAIEAIGLLRKMPFKAPPDLSKFLLSPMPGLLAEVVVKPGQVVQAGERLAVIEAMKMENILTAAHDGTVVEVLATKGESLAVDQPILSFA